MKAISRETDDGRVKHLEWRSIIQKVLKKPPHSDLRVPKSKVIPPEEVGFESRSRMNDAKKNYGTCLTDGRGIHIKEHETIYTVHWDISDSSKYPFGHLRNDAPGWWTVLTTGGSALLGGLFSEDRKKGAIKGGVFGLIFGLLTSGDN